MLCKDQYAAKYPFDYQKADRLVYCNVLEHLLLHVKIAEETITPDTEFNDMKGIGGALAFICRELNDIYSGKEPADEWRKNIANAVKDDFDDYIAVLKRLWNIVESNITLKAVITKEIVCSGSDGKTVTTVLNALNNDNE